ncbi:universal stress protein [bacterium]|nr:universal stress protein [bacterium]
MESIDTILVPNDFSDCAPGVVRRAAQMARALDAELVVMHSYEVPTGLTADTRIEPSPGAGPVAVGDHLRGGAEGRMPAYVGIAEAEGARARGLVVPGKPVDAILAAADDVGAGLIVMGTHGRRGLHRLLLGSVAEAVARRSEIPVMTVRSRWHGGCEAKSCAVCTTHMKSELVQVRAELDG